MSHCGISVVINVRLYDSQDALKTGAQEDLSGVLHYHSIFCSIACLETETV